MTPSDFSKTWDLACQVALSERRASWIRNADRKPGSDYTARTADPLVNPRAVGCCETSTTFRKELEDENN